MGLPASCDIVSTEEATSQSGVVLLQKLPTNRPRAFQGLPTLPPWTHRFARPLAATAPAVIGPVRPQSLATSDPAIERPLPLPFRWRKSTSGRQKLPSRPRWDPHPDPCGDVPSYPKRRSWAHCRTRNAGCQGFLTAAALVTELTRHCLEAPGPDAVGGRLTMNTRGRRSDRAMTSWR
jgi:hypothetical protein